MREALLASPAIADEAGLREYGERLGAALRPPVVIALHGEMGAGKTTLAQAIARGAGVEAAVTSPTFALVHEYAGRNATVFHLDLYRLNSEAELTNIGWDEIQRAEGIVIVEWPERAGTRLPLPRIDVYLREVDGAPDGREVEVMWRE